MLLASGMVDTVPHNSICIWLPSFSEKSTSLPWHMRVPVGAYLTEMVIHFRPGFNSPENRERKIVSLSSEKNVNNAESPSRKCMKKRSIFFLYENLHKFSKSQLFQEQPAINSKGDRTPIESPLECQDFRFRSPPDHLGRWSYHESILWQTRTRNL